MPIQSDRNRCALSLEDKAQIMKMYFHRGAELVVTGVKTPDGWENIVVYSAEGAFGWHSNFNGPLDILDAERAFVPEKLAAIFDTVMYGEWAGYRTSMGSLADGDWGAPSFRSHGGIIVTLADGEKGVNGRGPTSMAMLSDRAQRPDAPASVRFGFDETCPVVLGVDEDDMRQVKDFASYEVVLPQETFPGSVLLYVPASEIVRDVIGTARWSVRMVADKLYRMEIRDKDNSLVSIRKVPAVSVRNMLSMQPSVPMACA